MDWKKFVLPLVSWWWLLIIATGIAAGSSYMLVRQQPPVFQAKATLMIGRTIQDPNPNSNEFFLAQQLAQTYADIARREPTQKAVMDSLGLKGLPKNTIRTISGNPLIEILVQDTDPARAQAVANALAAEIMKRSPTDSKPGETSRQDFINDQLNKLQQQIDETQSSLTTLQQQLGELNSAREIADTKDQIKVQQEKLDSLRLNYANLLSTTQEGASNIMTLIEPAELPVVPIGPKKALTIALASVIGLFLAIVAIFSIEVLDDTLRSSDDYQKIANLPVLGRIPDMPKNINRLTYVLEEPATVVAESFRIMRTYLDFLATERPLKLLLVTSAAASDGKSTVAANLAASLAQGNRRVILVDADLRNPTIHTAFPSDSPAGLYEVCVGETTVQEALTTTSSTYLKLIASGTTPPSPAELLSSKRMLNVLDTLMSMTDVVVVDCPPIFLADTMILTKKADGILLVASLGQTRKRDMIKTIEMLQEMKVNLLGVVLNRVPQSAAYYKKGYYYNKNKNRKPAEGKWRISLPRRFRKPRTDDPTTV